MRSCLASLLAVALAIAPLPALAQEPDEATKAEAKEHFDKAGAAYNAEDYATAAAELEAAYALTPEPTYLYPWAQSLRLSGDCRRAIDIYKLFLETDPPRKQRDLANENIVRCLEEVENEPAPEPEPETETETEPEPESEPEPEPEPEPLPPPRPWYTDVAGGVLLGTGLAATAAGGALVGIGRSNFNKGQDSSDHAEFEDLSNKGSTQNTTGFIVLGVGGALLVGAAVRYAVVGAKARRQGASASLWMLPGGVGVGASGRF